jgi:polyhydroxyalkanoate synthesis regulator phasin
MKLVGAAFQVPGKVEAFTNEQSRHLATALRLATAEDMKKLERQVKRLEREVEKLQTQLAAGKHP